MKEVSLDTVGGRVRKVRQDAQQSMQTFAEVLGITGNYVGLLERGQRNPSEALLSKISSTMGVSYEWLAYGDQSQVSHPISYANNEVSDPAPMVNPQLYLSIAVGMAPAITRETLAPILTVPLQTIDDILAGKAVPYSPQWRIGYTIVAKNLDLPALRQDLRNLDAYLAWEQVNIRSSVMLLALQDYAAKSYEQVEVCSINGQAPDAVPTHTPYTDIILECHKEAYTFTWQFRCLPEQDDPDDFSPEDVLQHAEALAEQRGCKVSIVLASQVEYDLMCGHCSKLETNADAAAELDGLCQLPHNVSFVYFDQMTGKVDEREFFGDDDFCDEL